MITQPPHFTDSKPMSRHMHQPGFHIPPALQGPPASEEHLGASGMLLLAAGPHWLYRAGRGGDGGDGGGGFHTDVGGTETDLKTSEAGFVSGVTSQKPGSCFSLLQRCCMGPKCERSKKQEAGARSASPMG